MLVNWIAENVILYAHLAQLLVIFLNVQDRKNAPGTRAQRDKLRWLNPRGPIKSVDLGDFGAKYRNAFSVKYAYPIFENEIDSNGVFRM